MKKKRGRGAPVRRRFHITPKGMEVLKHTISVQDKMTEDKMTEGTTIFETIRKRLKK